jgi:hypothetical protein
MILVLFLVTWLLGAVTGFACSQLVSRRSAVAQVVKMLGCLSGSGMPVIPIRREAERVAR